MTRKNKRSPVTYVFIDASNIIYGASEAGWKMDFAKLMQYLTSRYQAKKVFYYAGLDPRNRKQAAFYKKLEEFGYRLRLVPVKIFRDGSKKGDVDSLLTFELMKFLDEYDRAVVMTGDGDYLQVLKYLMETGTHVTLLSFTDRASDKLKGLVAGNLAGLKSLRHLLEFEDKKMR